MDSFLIICTLFLVALLLVLLLVIVSIISHTEKNKKQGGRKKQHKPAGPQKTVTDSPVFDSAGYDAEGYGREGYNRLGKNRKGQYNRLFDTTSSDAEGFYDPDIYPIFVTPHAERRFAERLGITDPRKMRLMAIDAYRFGKSKRQIMKSSAYLVEEMEQKHSNSVVLIYRNVIYIFSVENVLITLYKNDKITL